MHTLFFHPFRNFSFLFRIIAFSFLEICAMILSEVKRMKEKFQKFMMGRYGVDAFSRFLLGAVIVLWVINIFADSRILYSWSLLLLLYSYYRMFSRNTTKRYQENQKFLSIKSKILSKLKFKNGQTKQPKTHHIYKCPTCKQKIRIPKGKGRICITCPKCKTEFTKVS